MSEERCRHRERRSTDLVSLRVLLRVSANRDRRADKVTQGVPGISVCYMIDEVGHEDFPREWNGTGLVGGPMELVRPVTPAPAGGPCRLPGRRIRFSP